MLPFILYVLFWPFGVVEFFRALFTDVNTRGFQVLGMLGGLAGIPLVLYVFIRPIGNEFFRTDWRSQLGPLAVLMVYGSYLVSFVTRGCWSEDYLPYAAAPVLLFLVAQLGIFLANLRNSSPQHF